MSRDIDNKKLIEDYLKHQEERDDEFQFQEVAGVLLDNMKASLGETPTDDLLLLRDELKYAKFISSETNWQGKPFSLILDKLIAIQKEKLLSVREVLDVLVTLKRNGGDELAAEDGKAKAIWMKLLFRDFNVRLRDVDALGKEINPYPLNVLDRVFSNMQTFDEESAFRYFKTLNEASFEFGLKMELLDGSNGLSTILKSFDEGEISLYYMKTQELLRKRGFYDEEIAEIFKPLYQMLENDWTLIEFFTLIDEVLKKCSIGQELRVMKCLGNCLAIAVDYKMSGGEFLSTINRTINSEAFNDEFEKLEEVFHAEALRKFGQTHQKSVQKLLTEIANGNGWTDETNIYELRGMYENVMTALNCESSLVGKVIESFTLNDVELWVKKFREVDMKPQRAERVAIVMRAFSLFKGYTIRDVQLLSLLLLYKPEAGTLAQVNTGEGKTAIIAMLACLFCLEGKKADIVTSSPELAKPQADELKNFYNILGFTSSHIDVDDKRAAYECNVIYGSIDEYEADILKDEYGKQGTRSNRPFEIALVDEVDSMLIDGKNFMVRLSTPVPGMNELEPILAAIWIHLDIVASKVVEKNGEIFYTDNPDDENTFFLLNVSKFDFIKKSVEDHIRLLLRDRERISPENTSLVDQYPEMEIPSYLRSFIFENRVENWILNAIQAKFNYVNGRDYIIENKQIRIVDVNNTGVIHMNMTWSDGLHQFLQMKHGARLSSEQMTTNFIANPTFFMRFGKNIYGLSGTLGLSEAQRFLRETYKVELIVIPSFKLKMHIELSPTIRSTIEEWRESIVWSTMAKLRNNRACLIIAESINEAKKIQKLFVESRYPEAKILMYTSEKNKKAIQKDIDVGEVIISTNIAGRGTDIKLTDQVNRNGGLHLCLTFLPINDRVELQNIGRTSRTGNPGTSQHVLFDRDQNRLEFLQIERDAMNLEAFKTAAKDMKKIIMKAKVFQKFCATLAIVRGYEDAPNNWGTVASDGCSQILVGDATEERFGLWLKSNEEAIDHADNYMDKFEHFEKQIRNDAIAGGLVRNPFYYVRSGKEFLDQDRLDSAQEQFTKAVNIEGQFTANGLYNRAYTLVKRYGDSDQMHEIDKAIDDFKKARRILENRKTDLHLITKTCTSEESSELYEQVMRKTNLLEIQISAINRAIGYNMNALQKQMVELEKFEKDIQTRINNFESLEVLKQKFKQASDEFDKLVAKFPDGNEELEKAKVKLDELSDAILGFQTKEDLENQLKEIKLSIEDVDKKMKVTGVLTEARANDKRVTIKLVTLDTILEADTKNYDEEVYEFEFNGYLGSFEVTEIPVTDWWSVFALLFIGIVQMVAGAAIAVFTCGAAASFGLGMILEGVSDVITAVRDGIINKNFSWKSWAISKAISYTVSIVCAGLGALKNIATAAYSTIKSATMGATILTETVKEGWKQAAKRIGVELAKGVAKELVNTAIDYTLSATLIPEIEKEIARAIEPKIQSTLLKDPTVKKMLRLDEFNKNRNYENLLKNLAMEILYSPDAQNSLKTYALGVVEGIASQKGLGQAINVLRTVTAVAEAVSFVDVFMSKLEKKLEEQAKVMKIDKQIAELEPKNKNESKTQDRDGTNQVNDTAINETPKDNTRTQPQENGNSHEAQQSIESNRVAEVSNSSKDLELTNSKNEEVIGYEYVKRDSNFIAQISEKASSLITAIVKGKIVMPAVYAATNFGINRLSKSLDKALSDNLELYKSKRNVIHSTNNDRYNLDKKYKQNYLNPENQLKLDKVLQDVKSGSELGLIHMGSLAKIVGQPIQVLDSKGKILFEVGKTQRDQKFVKVQYHPATADRPRGHYTLPGNIEAPNVGSGINDCLLNVVHAQVPNIDNPFELRSKLADTMEQNRNWIANAMPDYTKLQKEMQAGLFEGGARYRAGSIQSVIELSQSNKSFKSKAKAHPLGHFDFPDFLVPDDPAGDINSAKNYSRVPGPRGNFIDRSALASPPASYNVMDKLLTHPEAVIEIAKLNTPGVKAAFITFNRNIIESLGLGDYEVISYKNGVLDQPPQGQRRVLDSFFFKFGHQQGQQNNPNADVFIQTAYPIGRLENIPNLTPTRRKSL